ncbi:MAG: hypothetical protein KKB50_14835 [Planctomycetes bacterium]|nr:hypothetical protein [Planctomycetota bacterium]
MCRSSSAHLLSSLANSGVARCALAGVLGLLMMMSVCPDARADRPLAVDHSTEIYFPPIGQQTIGDCTCWSSCFYYNTYVQARDHGLDASINDPDVICSPWFIFSLISQTWWGAECTEHAASRLSAVGCSSISLRPMSGSYAQWPTEAAWVGALKNRMGDFHKIRADNTAGLEIVKQHIADGGCAVTRADFLSNYGEYGSTGSGTGISNHVMYRREGWHYLRHSICICGYDDERQYIDDRDGLPYTGAFLVANSEGQNWGWYNSTGTGTRGFIWIAYNMFLEGECGWYDYELDVSPCFDNAPYPEIYFHDDRPDYVPVLYAAAGISHYARNQLTFSGGIGPTSAPEFTGPNAIEATDYGEIAMDVRRRIVVDLTDGADLIQPGVSKNVFISLTVEPEATQSASIMSVDFFFDPDGDGEYTVIPGEMTPPVTVAPGTTGYVSALVTGLGPGDLNCDGAVNGFDIDPFLLVLGGTPPYDDYYAQYPWCDHMQADVNGDGVINGFDIDAFVTLLSH